MDGFSDEVRSAADELGRIEADRDLALARSRKVIRLSKRVIHGIHTGSAVEDDVAGLEAAMAELMSVEAPEVRGSSLVQDAAMEYAEAMLLLSLVTSGRVPSHSDLGISAAAWVLGLADCVGELRRILTRDLMDLIASWGFGEVGKNIVDPQILEIRKNVAGDRILVEQRNTAPMPDVLNRTDTLYANIQVRGAANGELGRAAAPGL